MGAFNLNTANDTLRSATASRLTIAREPDGEWRPRALGVPPALARDTTGLPFPTVVVEVACSETTSSLHTLAPIYLGANTSIQLYVGIKIFPRRANGKFAMLALLYSRANLPFTTPVQAISCGTAPIIQRFLPPLLHRGGGTACCGHPACTPLQPSRFASLSASSATGIHLSRSWSARGNAAQFRPRFVPIAA